MGRLIVITVVGLKRLDSFQVHKRRSTSIYKWKWIDSLFSNKLNVVYGLCFSLILLACGSAFGLIPIAVKYIAAGDTNIYYYSRWNIVNSVMVAWSGKCSLDLPDTEQWQPRRDRR